eukprot:GHVR01063195.1.p1 GENE.GHVR01063195.1~~GHVR01063195.1.p1  ORF type:complete len:135 (-),score=6.24 GHVR01063195.1:536-940(-)
MLFYDTCIPKLLEDNDYLVHVKFYSRNMKKNVVNLKYPLFNRELLKESIDDPSVFSKRLNPWNFTFYTFFIKNPRSFLKRREYIGSKILEDRIIKNKKHSSITSSSENTSGVFLYFYCQHTHNEDHTVVIRTTT